MPVEEYFSKIIGKKKDKRAVLKKTTFIAGNRGRKVVNSWKLPT